MDSFAQSNEINPNKQTVRSINKNINFFLILTHFFLFEEQNTASIHTNHDQKYARI